MKRIITASLLTLSLAIVAPVFAGSTSTATSTATSTKKENAQGAKHAKIGERVIRELKRNLENLKDIRTRAAERIAKLESAGGNVTDVKARLATADVKIAAAEVEINTLATALAPYETTLPKDKTADLMKSAKKAQDALRTAHRALVDVIVHIRPGQILPRGVATTTATTTATSSAMKKTGEQKKATSTKPESQGKGNN